MAVTAPIPEAQREQAGVDISGLSVAYRRHGRLLPVLSDLSLRIAPGEAYGLVGESGCGKSTVAMAMMRYLPGNAVVQSGAIRVLGEDLLDADERALRRLRGDRIAMVYQDPGSALNPAMRIGSQIDEIFRHQRGLDGDAARAASLTMLEKVQISDPKRVADRYPHELSGGQQQRVMIAMALSTDPSVLVLDEPTTGLDATVEAEVLDLVEGLRNEFAASILFISHNLGIVARVCDRLGVLYAGRIVEEGPADEVLGSPRHPYTLGLLRCIPRVGATKERERLATIPGGLPPLGTQLPGCMYATRCPLAQARCRESEPPLLQTGAGRTSRCWFHEEVPIIPAPAADPHVRSSTTAEPLLVLDELVKTYAGPRGDVQAVAGVSLEIRRGEIFGLVGESGSGKSSLAQCAVGLLDASEGVVLIDGRDMSSRASHRDRRARRQVQMVFQNPDAAMNPSRTVRKTLSVALKLLADTPRRERAAEAERLAQQVSLAAHHLDVRPSALSGGLKQRAAIASALAGKPSLVVCDEPVSALDVSVQAAILNLLVDLRAQAELSYLFISHDLSVVRYLADRIGVMYLGQLVEIGSAAQVFEPPHHPYTEALASAIPSVEPERRRPRIKLRGSLPSPAEPPTGCRFHTRCPRFLGDLCRTQSPPWQQGADGHDYRCHIPPDELAVKQRTPPADRKAADRAA